MTLVEFKARADALAAKDPHLRAAVTAQAARLAKEGRTPHGLLDAVIVLAVCHDGPLEEDLAARLAELESYAVE